ITRMGRELDTTLFIQNGPSMAGLGSGGGGGMGYSVAGPPGGGGTTPLTVTRPPRPATPRRKRVVLYREKQGQDGRGRRRGGGWGARESGQSNTPVFTAGSWSWSSPLRPTERTRASLSWPLTCWAPATPIA